MWTIGMRVASRAIGLVSIVILARILVPEDFGLVAMATLFAAAVEMLGYFNFEVWLIRNQDWKRSHYDTVWTLNLIRALLTGGVIVALAPVAASFFGQSRLESLVYIIGITTFISGFQNSGVIEFQKELRFDKDFVMLFLPRLIGTVVTIALALSLRNYWALAIGLVATAGCRVITSFVLHPYRPKLGLQDWGDALAYSKWLLANNVLKFFYRRTDVIVVGRIGGTEATGIYSLAFEIANLVTSELITPLRRALVPGFAKNF